MSSKPYDPKHPVSHIEHQQEKRASIPTTERQGEESAIVDGEPQQSEYDIFRHEFRRGNDPELYWLNKYRNDNEDTQHPSLKTDIRSLYVHENINPEQLINRLYRVRDEKTAGFENQTELFEEMFREQDEEDELERVASYYQHNENWKNRLILGDSLLVMNSLLNREGMRGQVQCVYIDPPYGIKYGGNWQMRINSTNVKENDGGISGEPETIKAYRDTWELGINSYLSYLRDRLVMARELLTESGSCFVQISDENVHLVRNLMDEVFGSENFVSQIVFTKTTGFTANTIGNVCDFIIWYAKDIRVVKVRKLFEDKDVLSDPHYNNLELADGRRLTIRQWEEETHQTLSYSNRPKGSRIFTFGDMNSQGEANAKQPYEFDGKIYYPSPGRHWTANYPIGMNRLKENKRIYATDNKLRYIRYFEDFPKMEITNLWIDILGVQSRKDPKVYVVQTATKAIQRCILMTTDPGDLVLDPTCGSGTTAYVAEQWGRRWITIDTSRIAQNIAKRRLTTALFPYYETYDENIRHGFRYKKVPHITLKSLANDLPAEEEILYDQPEIDKKRIRVSGPFTVETLQNYNVQSPESLVERKNETEDNQQFVERIFSNLRANGIRNGLKGHAALFHGLQPVANPYLNARGYYKDEQGNEVLAYLMIGPKFGTVSKQSVNMAIREFRQKLNEGASTLYILGFSFEDDIKNEDIKDYNLGTFHVVKVRMNDDLLQDGLLKKDKTAGSFIIIGEPDIRLVRDDDDTCHVEIQGMDMYDPIQDRVAERNVADIAYWELDDRYSGTEFVVRSIHFCGGDKKEFNAWKKGLQSVTPSVTPRQIKRDIGRTLRMEFPEEVWNTLYDFRSAPIKYEKGRKLAVRVISQFGEESTKVITLN
jgi:adenine-specific DNA-methyltransferase